MKKLIFVCIAACTMLFSCKKAEPRIVIISFDGLRWQELYSGADTALVTDTRFVKDTTALKAEFWRDTPEERREVLAPFYWSYVKDHGYMLGNRYKNSLMQVSNAMHFSYPGYSEMFSGYPDDERISSNADKANPNHTVIEALQEDPRYKGKTLVYCSWEVIRNAVNVGRAGIPANLRRTTHNLIEIPGLGIQDIERDATTFSGAITSIIKDHPSAIYIGVGDTDKWGHNERYDLYLKSIHVQDAYVRKLVETCESDPYYKGKTTYLLTCDHGRGDGPQFTDHWFTIPGSDKTWFMTFGAGVPALGETTDNGPFWTKQFAATIAMITGIDFTPDNGVKPEPFDPTFKGE